MASVQTVTRGADAAGLPKVYLYGCPQESAAVYAQLCEEILAEVDCAVQYDPEAAALPQDLTGVQLVAVAVTEWLLAQPDHLLAGVVQAAAQKGIPVLPLIRQPEHAKRCMRRFGGFDAALQFCTGVQKSIAEGLNEPLVQLASFVCYRLGELHLDAASVQPGIRWYGRDLELWKQVFAVTGTVQARKKQLLACLRMGDACYAEVQAREAQYWYRLAVSHGEALVQQTGEDWAKLCLAQCCNAVGDLFQYNENPAAATVQYKKSMALLEEMADPTPAARQELAQCYGHMAELRMAEEHYPVAEEWLRKKLQLDQLLSAAGGEPEQVSCAITMANLAKTVLYQGRYNEAEELYHSGLAILDRLWQQNDSPLAHREWQSTCQDLAEFYQMMGNWNKAQIWLDAAMSGARPETV